MCGSEEFKQLTSALTRGGQMEQKNIYVVIHASGCYSDYAEYVVGVTDSYELALSYADKEAEATNNDERYWFYHDTIRIRRYELNRYNRYLSEAEKVVENIEMYRNEFEYDETIYEESATQDKFVKVKKDAA
ncbi:hypothetical protein [Limosilactobacillus reuteri]|nr:hypothetical protein [Limosilactobacillus reuteri]